MIKEFSFMKFGMEMEGRGTFCKFHEGKVGRLALQIITAIDLQCSPLNGAPDTGSISLITSMLGSKFGSQLRIFTNKTYWLIDQSAY